MSYARHQARLANRSIAVVESLDELRAIPKFDDKPIQYIRSTGYDENGQAGSGTFWYNANNTSDDNDGTVIKPAWAGASGRYIRSLESGYVSVKAFGAKGDNVTDDTAAIQAAFEAAAGADFSLLFDRGWYRITAPIIVYSATRAHFNADANLVRDFGGAGEAENATLRNEHQAAGGGDANIAFTGRVQMTDTAYDGSDETYKGVQIGFWHVDNLTIEAIYIFEHEGVGVTINANLCYIGDVAVRNPDQTTQSHAVQIRGGEIITINSISGVCGGNMLGFYASDDGKSSDIFFVTVGSITGKSSASGAALSCYAVAAATTEINAIVIGSINGSFGANNARCISLKDETGLRLVRDIVINGGYINKPASANGILLLSGVAFCRITSMVLNDAQSGSANSIDISDSHQCTISACRVDAVQDNGGCVSINGGSSSIIVNANYLRSRGDTTSPAIQIDDGSTYIRLVGNTISSENGRGVNVLESSNVDVMNNSVQADNGYAIYAALNAAYAAVVGNSIRSFDTSPLWLMTGGGQTWMAEANVVNGVPMQGSASFANGTATATISHGCNLPTYNVMLGPRSPSMGFYVSANTGTSFTITRTSTTGAAICDWRICIQTS